MKNKSREKNVSLKKWIIKAFKKKAVKHECHLDKVSDLLFLTK